MITNKLLEGIKNSDWDLVIQVWETLTGNKYQVELLEDSIKPKAKRKYTKKNTTPKNDPLDEGVYLDGYSEDFSVKKKSKTIQKANRPNLFESMQVSIEREPGYDKINDKVKRVPRNRPPARLKSVVCARCGKQEEVTPILARENYKCNKCGAKGA